MPDKTFSYSFTINLYIAVNLHSINLEKNDTNDELFTLADLQQKVLEDREQRTKSKLTKGKVT